MDAKGVTIDQLLRRLQQALELSDDDVARIGAFTDDAGRFRLGEACLEVAISLAEFAGKFGETTEGIIGLAPDKEAVLSVLHAVDPDCLSTAAIDRLVPDLLRLFEPQQMPRRLILAIRERMASVAAAVKDAEAEKAAWPQQGDIKWRH